MLDVGTDGVTLALPAPFDLMDLPAAMADASISFAAHKALKQEAKAKVENTSLLVEPDKTDVVVDLAPQPNAAF